jgi:hypothetical protein
MNDLDREVIELSDEAIEDVSGGEGCHIDPNG